MKTNVKVTNNEDKSVNKYTVEMDEPLCSKIKFSCIGILIAIFVISILAGIATIGLCCKCGIFENIKVCKFANCVIKVAVFLSVTSIMLIFTAKTLKPYAKMAFLGEIINLTPCLECPKDCNSQDNASDNAEAEDNKTKGGTKDAQQDTAKENAVSEKLARDKALIKKFCDTLVEL